MSESKSRKIDRTVEIAATPEQVWHALTDPQELARWFPTEAQVKPGAGGEILWNWLDKYKWTTHIEVWEEPKYLRLVYDHKRDFAAGHPETQQEKGMVSEQPDKLAIDYRLEARGGKTTLRLVHSGFGADTSWDDEYDGTSRGWKLELQQLKYYLENHRGRDRALAWFDVKLSGSPEFVWQKLMGKHGFFSDGDFAELAAGGAYSLSTATGDRLSGNIIVCDPPFDLEASVQEFDGLLLVWLDKSYGLANVYLSSYSLPQKSMDELRKRWEAHLPAFLGSS